MGGKWVNVTTLPMSYAAYPLYRLGGDRAVAAAPDARARCCARSPPRALARRLGGGDGWAAFWIIGLASPVAIYALDFWEHTLGLGLMLWGVVLLLDVLERGPAGEARCARVRCSAPPRPCAPRRSCTSWSPCGLVCLTMLVPRPKARSPDRHRPPRPWSARGVPLVANRVLEQLTIGTDLRGSRVAGHGVGRRHVARRSRAREALTTAVGTGMSGLKPSGEVMVGAVAVACVACRRVVPGELGATAQRARRRARRRRRDGLPRPVRAGLGIRPRHAGGVAARGGGGVPGVVASGAAVARGDRGASALPDRLVRAVPGWGRPPVGRSLHPHVRGAARRRRMRRAPGPPARARGRGDPCCDRHPWPAWAGSRSARTRLPTAWRPSSPATTSCVISRQTHLLREGGAFYDSDEHWLTATTDAAAPQGGAHRPRAGAHEFALIDGSDVTPPQVARRLRAGTHAAGAVHPSRRQGRRDHLPPAVTTESGRIRGEFRLTRSASGRSMRRG